MVRVGLALTSSSLACSICGPGLLLDVTRADGARLRSLPFAHRATPTNHSPVSLLARLPRQIARGEMISLASVRH